MSIKDQLFRIAAEEHLWKSGESDTIVGNAHSYKLMKSINGWWDLDILGRHTERICCGSLSRAISRICKMENIEY